MTTLPIAVLCAVGAVTACQEPHSPAAIARTAPDASPSSSVAARPMTCTGRTVRVPGSHAVGVADLCCDIEEVSAAAFLTYLGQACGYTSASLTLTCHSFEPDCGRWPMNCLTTDDAEDYCRSRGARLPSVREWAWVATNGSLATKYPWGNGGGPPELCVGSHCTLHDVADVSLLGVHGLAGGLREWARDDDGTYSIMGALTPQGIDRTGVKTLVTQPPGIGRYFIGFRCVASVGSMNHTPSQ